MPTDKAGRYHLNTQRAMASDRRAGGGEEHGDVKMETDIHHGDGEAHTTLHDHGDGTFHTETHDGERTEHPHIGHALAHLHGKHGGGAKHINVHSDGGGTHVTHQHDGSGNVEGPHDHENIAALKDHMDQFLSEEANEWSGDDYAAHKGAGARY